MRFTANSVVKRRGSAILRLPGLLGTLCAIIPFVHVAGGGGTAILLRYRFVAGQRFLYRLQGSVREERVSALSPGFKRSTIEQQQVDALTDYHILSVAPDGVATAAVRIDTAVITATLNGRSTVEHLAASQAAATQETDLLGPDNTLPRYRNSEIPSNSYGPFGVQTIGALPAYPVHPGMSWTSTASGNLAIMFHGELPDLPVRITAQNTLIGYQQQAGHLLAVITSGTPIAYATTISSGGQPVHVKVTGSIALTSSFELSQKRLYAANERADLTYVIASSRMLNGHPLASRTHVVDAGTVQEVPLRSS